MKQISSRVIFLVVLLICSGIGKAQEIGFEFYLETDYDEQPVDFTRSADGNFVGLVHKAPPTGGAYIYSSYLYSIGLDGDTMSIKFSKEDTIFRFNDIDRLSTNPTGFLLSGRGYKTGESPNHPFTIFRRINDDFETLWEKTYLFNNYFFGSAKSHALELISGDLMFACSPLDANDMFILRLSGQGDSLDYMAYSGDDAGDVYGLTYSPDSTSVWLHTQWAHYASGDTTCTVISLNEALEQTDYYYYPIHFTTPYSSLCYPGNRLLSGGTYFSYNPNTNVQSDMISAYLLDTLVNETHEVLLTDPDTLSRTGEIQGIDYYYPGCIYLGGTHNTQWQTGNQPSWIYITKLNDTLGVEYEKYLGGDYYYWLFTVTAATDGGVLLTGFRQDISPAIFERDGFFIKLDSTGCLTQNQENTTITISDAIVYPNPGNEFVIIRTALKGCIFYLYDESGNQILKKPLEASITTVNTNMLISGSYFYSILNNTTKITSGSWIKN